MKIEFLKDDEQDLVLNKKIFSSLTEVDFDSIVDKIIKKLGKSSDEIQLTFFFNIKTPNFIYIEKLSDKMPAFEYYKTYVDCKRIKETEPVTDVESFYILDICKINNKQYDDITTEYDNHIKI